MANSAEFEENARVLLAKCGRHCCICRRFRPTRIQVHHIQLQSEGGSDDIENLIPACNNCHIDVHSQVPFMRRFSAAELKRHRETTIRLVQDGRLVPSEDLWSAQEHVDSDHARALGFDVVSEGSLRRRPLSEVEAKLILGLADAQGRGLFTEHLAGFDLSAGSFNQSMAHSEHRDARRLKSMIEGLEEHGLLDRHFLDSHSFTLELTELGYQAADDLETDISREVAGE